MDLQRATGEVKPHVGVQRVEVRTNDRSEISGRERSQMMKFVRRSEPRPRICRQIDRLTAGDLHRHQRVQVGVGLAGERAGIGGERAHGAGMLVLKQAIPAVRGWFTDRDRLDEASTRLWGRAGTIWMAIRPAVGVGGCRLTRSDRCSGSVVRRRVWSVWRVVDMAGRGWSEGVEQAEERSQPGVVGEDAPPHASAGGDDLAGDLDEGGEEGAEVHREQASALLVVTLGPARGDW